MMTPSASAPAVIESGDNVFQICFTDPNQGVASADYIAENKLGTKVGIIYDSSDAYSSGIYEKFKAEASLGEAKQVMASAKAVGGLLIITGTRQGLDANALRTMGDFLRDKDPSVVAVIASINGEKVSFLAVCGKEAVARGIKAGDLVRSVSAVCGGKGGGKPDSAMGGGTELLKVDDALASVDDFVSEKLS